MSETLPTEPREIKDVGEFVVRSGKSLFPVNLLRSWTLLKSGMSMMSSKSLMSLRSWC